MLYIYIYVVYALFVYRLVLYMFRIMYIVYVMFIVCYVIAVYGYVHVHDMCRSCCIRYCRCIVHVMQLLYMLICVCW